MTCLRGHDLTAPDAIVMSWYAAKGKHYPRCRLCRRHTNAAAQIRRHGKGPGVPAPYAASSALWVDAAAEYRFLREQGLTPAEIATKFGVTGRSMERLLYRHIGRKEKW